MIVFFQRFFVALLFVCVCVSSDFVVTFFCISLELLKFRVQDYRGPSNPPL